MFAILAFYLGLSLFLNSALLVPISIYHLPDVVQRHPIPNIYRISSSPPTAPHFILLSLLHGSSASA